MFTSYPNFSAFDDTNKYNRAKIDLMDQVAIDKKIEQAEEIVNTYGALLNNLKHVNTALPESLLPNKKDTIKQAIQTLLWELEDLDTITRNSLVQAYVFLEQFLPDAKVEVLARGQAAIQSADPEHHDWQYADQANEIVTNIKVAMENAMQDMRIYLHPK
ncbi:MAG: hypothetical protein PVG20_08755 [Thioalkalispiraceae bacterium]